jgi:hypothetical protein
MREDSQPSLNVSPTWSAVWVAAIAGGVIAGIGILVRLALLHDVAPLEDAILRSLEQRGVSLVLQPNWTEPLVGLTEITGFGALGAVIGTGAALLHASTTQATCVTVAIVGLVQILFGLLPRVTM